jgi:hypothetical protein
MVFKKIVILYICLFVFSCSEDTDVGIARNLQEYVDENKMVTESSVLAWAANAEANTTLAYIFYASEIGASDIRYYELADPTLDASNFINYKRENLENTVVFEGKLNRFSRSGFSETWCLITYKKAGVLQISSPIKLNNTSKPTEYSNAVNMSYKTMLEPNFTWKDSEREESFIFFQTISNEANELVSGTFTKNTFFQYYDTSNVLETPSLNTKQPKALLPDQIYNFTAMGIGQDNWVNLIITEQFIPRNLEEYIAVNPDKEIASALAFGGTANGNKEETYVYFYPIEGAFNYRYYETNNTSVLAEDYSKYKRRKLKEIPRFDGKLRRFSQSSSKEVWCLVTFEVVGKLHISAAIKTKNNTRQTEWKTAVDIDNATVLKPIFSWLDGNFLESKRYLQVFSKSDGSFLSGTFTVEKTFQYYSEANITDKIHTDVPEELVIDGRYDFFLFGLSSDNWVNIIIQNTFIAQ